MRKSVAKGCAISSDRSRVRRLFDWIANPRSNEHTSYAVLKRLTSVIQPDFKLSSPFVDWQVDPSWPHHFEKFGDSPAKAHRLFFLSSVITSLQRLPGDTAECGAYRGSSSALICAANRRAVHDRVHFVFDSFQGLSAPATEDCLYWTAGDLSSDESGLRLQEYDGEYQVMKGWIPQRFAEIQDRRFAFVHIDVDLMQPTADSLEFFYPRMNPGSIILCDDYGSLFCPGATEAVNEFCERHELLPVALPAGGAFIRIG